MRAFKVPPEDRARLKELIGSLEGGRRPRPRASQRRAVERQGLPEIGVVEITDVDLDGEMLAAARSPEDAPHLPAIYVVAERGAPALGVGERAVARFTRLEDGSYEARIMRALWRRARSRARHLPPREDGGRLEPTDRKTQTEFRVAESDRGGAVEGEIVLAEVLRSAASACPRRASSSASATAPIPAPSA